MMPRWSDAGAAEVSDPGYSNGQNIAVKPLNVRNARRIRYCNFWECDGERSIGGLDPPLKTN